MKSAAGLWIDHRKAVIVVVTDKGEEAKLIVSKIEKQLRRSGDSPLKGPYEAQQVPLDDSRESQHQSTNGIIKYKTFGALLTNLHATQDQFRTGWFL